MAKKEPGKVEPIIITDDDRKKYPKSVILAMELTNLLFNEKLCGLELTFTNGWVVKCNNKRFAKKLGVP